MRSDWIDPGLLDHILAALTPENELAMRVSLATGLRIDDVLHIKAAQVERGRRFTVTERKTGKKRRVYIPEFLHEEMLRQAGRFYVFPGRLEEKKPRTRQAVWKDLKRAAAAFRVSESLNVSPHSARKVYAVEAFAKYGRVDRVRELLNHGDEPTTALYLMSEALTKRKLAGRSQQKGRKKRTVQKKGGD